METPRIEVGHGVGKNGEASAMGAEAARQALRQITQHPLSAVLVFASVTYDLNKLLRGVHAVVGDVPVLGATTAGEVCNGPEQGSVVAVALASPDLKVRFGVGEGVAGDWRQALTQAVGVPELSPFFSNQGGSIWSELTLQGKSVFGLLFSPGNTESADSRSFEILEELKRLSGGRLPIMGGSAADGWRMSTNYVLCGRQAYPDSLVVAVFETRLRFGLALAHGFSPTRQRATVTCSTNHEVLELDYKPAAEVYSQLQGISREDLQGKHLTLTTKKPVGIPDPYKQFSINVASYFTEAGGVRFTQPVPEGTILTIMEANEDNLVLAGQEALRKAVLRGSITDPALILVFSCALRAHLLGERVGEEIAAMQNVLPGIPVVGYYSFGEQGLADDGVNRHNNGIITVLVLGRELSYAAQVALENEGLRSEVEQGQALKQAYASLEKEVAERQKAEEAFEKLVVNAPIGIFIVQGEKIKLVNPGLQAITGYTEDELLGKDSFGCIAPEYEVIVRQYVSRALKGKSSMPFEFQTINKHGERKWVMETVAPIIHEGKKGTLVYVMDISERKRLEEQLLQSQKMEAVGRLAGGVAHDFNNILMAIIGYSDMIRMAVNPDDPPYHDAELIIQVAERAVSRTRQLLAFGRKQILHPRVINLNEVVDNLETMLRRVIGEDIDLRIKLDRTLGTAKVDPGQIEQVMMNLVVNARDAMPQGGTLTIETANADLDDVFPAGSGEIQPGHYVMLAVSDTGQGMDQEMQSHIFEPFFTTKGPDKGTGLGLSTVYGIVKQSGGCIYVRSEPGQGSTFKVYFPRTEATAESREEPKPASAELQGSETILVVEDEEMVRALICRILEQHGYKVLAAGDGGEALLICQRHPGTIHLMVTDVVMPKMNGRELAEHLASLHPEIKVLYMSGYAEDVVVNRGALDSAASFLQKPFKPMLLVQKVREILDLPHGGL